MAMRTQHPVAVAVVVVVVIVVAVAVALVVVVAVVAAVVVVVVVALVVIVDLGFLISLAWFREIYVPVTQNSRKIRFETTVTHKLACACTHTHTHACVYYRFLWITFI